MISKILKAILSVAIPVLIVSFLIITGILYQYFAGIRQDQLKEQLSLAVSGTELLGMEYLESLTEGNYRLTWVSADGSVLFDSSKNPATMENHGNREEILEAIASGRGSSSRKSATFTENTIYEAKRLQDGSVLRISVSSATALALVLGLLQPISVILLIAFILAAWLANRMAKRLVEPLNKLNLEKPLENDTYEELSPLLRRIHTQQQQIKKQLANLNEKQKEFDKITGSMKEALVLLDEANRIVSINPTARTLFDAYGAYVGDDFMVLYRKQDMQEAIEAAKASGHTSFRSSHKGREYQFDLSRIDSEGHLQGLVIIAFDVTEQVNAEKNRHEFTANVSHELKTPLQSIIGSAELIENGIVKQEDMPRFIGHIRKEASRLITLIDDIIGLSLLDEGTDMPREDVSLLKLSQEVCETLADVAQEKKVSLEVSGDSGIMNGVRSLLYEVIYNLCDNAIKYNKVGGQVKVSLSENEKTIALSVEDTGVGIAPEYQDKIFERFYRVDKSHSKQSGGTGLGLSIVKHAVQYHDGEINLESRLDEGTKIRVLFRKA